MRDFNFFFVVSPSRAAEQARGRERETPRERERERSTENAEKQREISRESIEAVTRHPQTSARAQNKRQKKNPHPPQREIKRRARAQRTTLQNQEHTFD